MATILILLVSTLVAGALFGEAGLVFVALLCSWVPLVGMITGWF